MAVRVQFVTSSRRVAQMPTWSAEYAELVQFAAGRGILGELERRLRFAYKRGFEVLDLALFFMVLACGYGGRGGIRGFRRSVTAFATRLAAVAGRQHLPTASSVSRALGAADRIEDLSTQLAWLLRDGAEVGELVRSPLVQNRDAHGNAWTVLDFDPSVTALRQRSLPEAEDLPEPRRRGRRLCAPGYSGRHRGEVQFSTAILSHAGAGLFVQATTHAGNTPFAEALGTAGQAAAALVDGCGLTRDHTMIRVDGAGGYAAAMAQVRRHGLHFLARLKNLTMLTDPAVHNHLARAEWHDVADARSGPRREATELGRYALGLDDEGTPVQARLVASRFAAPDGLKHGAGLVRDGWHYEVFATDVDAAAWPAPDTVTLYYGRCGQENQFGRAVQELRLGDVFSFDLCGQRLATALMMWVSNLRLTRAAAAVGDLGTASAQQPRPTRETESAESAPALAQPQAHEVSQEPSQSPASDTVATMPTPADPAPQAPDKTLPTHQLCPRGERAPLHNIRTVHGRGCYGIYRMPAGACWACPQRTGCTGSTNPSYRREFSVPLSVEALAGRTRLLASLRADNDTAAAPTSNRKPRPSPPPSPPPAPRWTPPAPLTAGDLHAAAPSLRPAVLVRMWQRDLQRIVIEVRLHAPPLIQPATPWLVPTAASRQGRRRTWAQRANFNILQGRATVIRLPLVADSCMKHDHRKAA